MPKTLHDGHRHRMRERFLAGGFDGFAPHEVLELLLFYSRPRGDVNPLAHRLLDAFGSLKGVLEARPEQLMSVSGVGEETAALISLIVPLFRRYQACNREEPHRILGHADAMQYCISLLAGCRTERFYVIALSADRQLLGQRMISEGSLSEVVAYPRLVAETALNYNAFGILLCHNHPGGTLLPSGDDVSTTRQLQTLLTSMKIQLVDHIIVAGDEAYSMVRHGDLSTPKYLSHGRDGRVASAQVHES